MEGSAPQFLEIPGSGHSVRFTYLLHVPLPRLGRKVYMAHTSSLEPLEDMSKCDGFQAVMSSRGKTSKDTRGWRGLGRVGGGGGQERML